MLITPDFYLVAGNNSDPPRSGSTSPTGLSSQRWVIRVSEVAKNLFSQKPDALFWFLKEMSWEADNSLKEVKTNRKLTLA